MSYFTSLPNLWRVCIMKDGWILPDAFFASIEMIMVLFFVVLEWFMRILMICKCWATLHPRDNYHLIVVFMISFIYVRVCLLIFRWELFIWCVCALSLLSFGIRIMLGLKKKNLEEFHPFLYHGLIWRVLELVFL